MATTREPACKVKAEGHSARRNAPGTRCVPLRHPYITRKKGVCGGKPIIAGTRIKVAQIAIEYDRMGWTADDIIEAHPHLTLAQVHAALSYYYDHVEEINAQIREGERMVEEIRRFYAKPVPEEKRAEVKGLHR